MREKLIELIEEEYYCSIEELADYLIANGVTVQEWISVTCPVCGGATTIIETRSSEDSVRRRCKCLECGYRFTTIEIDRNLYENCRNATM